MSEVSPVIFSIIFAKDYIYLHSHFNVKRSYLTFVLVPKALNVGNTKRIVHSLLDDMM